MFKTLIADTNVFYDLGEGNKSLENVVADGDHLYYSPITVVEIAGKITDETFPRCKVAARAIIESDAKQLPDPQSHLTRLFGYEPAEAAFDWSNAVKAIAQAANIGELAKRGTEIADACLRKELAEARADGEMRVNGAALVVQYRCGYGRETPFPVHDGHQVDQATRWTLLALKTLFDHMERRQKVVTASALDQPNGCVPPEFRLAIEQYLEDILVAKWDSLDWGADLEYIGRQVPCGTLGRIDILARDGASGDFVVIELKRDQTDDEVIGQLSRYMGWAAEHKAASQGVGVRGIIVVHELTPQLRAAAMAHRNIEVFRYDLTVALTRIPVRKENASVQHGREP